MARQACPAQVADPLQTLCCFGRKHRFLERRDDVADRGEDVGRVEVEPTGVVPEEGHGRSPHSERAGRWQLSEDGRREDDWEVARLLRRNCLSDAAKGMKRGLDVVPGDRDAARGEVGDKSSVKEGEERLPKNVVAARTETQPIGASDLELLTEKREFGDSRSDEAVSDIEPVRLEPIPLVLHPASAFVRRKSHLLPQQTNELKEDFLGDKPLGRGMLFVGRLDVTASRCRKRAVDEIESESSIYREGGLR